MEKIVEHGLLYDFYGELLTAHQRQIYEDAVYQDMSLAEIADIHGISRQGVHDLIRRCDKILAQYEERLGLVKKFGLIKEKAQHMEALTGELLKEADKADSGKTAKQEIARRQGDTEKLLQIQKLSSEILDVL